MKIFLYFCLIGIATASCNRKMATEAPSSLADTVAIAAVADTAAKAATIPDCIQKKIESIKAERVWNPPAEIHSYEYNNQTVYVISADCCDMFISVVDENCKFLCAPSGGFTGRGDGKCPNFYNQAKPIGLVWKDDRRRK